MQRERKGFNVHKNLRVDVNGHQILYNQMLKGRHYPTHLTDTTALPFQRALFVILLYLIREEGIKDLVDQLCGGCFSWSLIVLFYLGWVTNSLSSGCPPANRIKRMIRGELDSTDLTVQIPDDK